MKCVIFVFLVAFFILFYAPRLCYSYYLPYTNTNTIFLTPTGKISFIIYSFDSHKSSGLNSIPVKKFKTTKK